MKSSNLSDEDKDALYEYLGNEELYDPSKDSGQKPADFKAKTHNWQRHKRGQPQSPRQGKN